MGFSTTGLKLAIKSTIAVTAGTLFLAPMGDEGSLVRRVAALDPDVRERIMMTAGVRDIESREPRSQHPASACWGFPDVPDLAHFCENAPLDGPRATDETNVQKAIHAAYASLTPGSVIWGRVVVSKQTMIEVDISRVVACDSDGHRPRRWIFSPNRPITGQCSRDEARDKPNHAVLPDEYPPGTPVFAVVLAVVPSAQQIHLSMRTSRLPRGDALFPPYQCGAWGGPRPALGKALDKPPKLPSPKEYEAEWRLRHAKETFVSRLESDPDFQSPYSTESTRAAMGVEYGWSVVHSGRHDPSEMERLLEKIKLEVRTAWAKESVAKGVSYNDAKRYGDAIKCFDEALKLDSKLVEGYVCRGAALANQGKYSNAVVDWQSAMNIDPEHTNARKYLKETLTKHPEVASFCKDATYMMSKGHREFTPDVSAAPQAPRAPEPERHARVVVPPVTTRTRDVKVRVVAKDSSQTSAQDRAAALEREVAAAAAARQQRKFAKHVKDNKGSKKRSRDRRDR